MFGVFMALSEQKKIHFYNRQLGKTRRVLFERPHRSGQVFGFTDNYVRVATPHRPHLSGQMLSVTLQALHANGYVSCCL